ncbi:hypothetical protein Esti_003111 [Eimeria stiedai]
MWASVCLRPADALLALASVALVLSFRKERSGDLLLAWASRCPPVSAASLGRRLRVLLLSLGKMVQLNKVPAFLTDASHPIGFWVCELRQFIADSIRLVRRCTKPDAREFKKIAWACAVGFLLMGFIGYIVKLVFIPINNILVGPGA